MSRFAGLIGCVAVASVALWPPSSPAQEPYPSRTVKIVVPAVAGSTTDTLARIMSDPTMYEIITFDQLAARVTQALVS